MTRMDRRLRVSVEAVMRVRPYSPMAQSSERAARGGLDRERRLTDDADVDPRKGVVRSAYDAIAETWGRERERMDDARELKWLERFCAALPGPRVLDLGCGGGAIS